MIIKFFPTIDTGEDIRNSQRRCLHDEEDKLAGEAPSLGQAFLTLAACWKHSDVKSCCPGISGAKSIPGGSNVQPGRIPLPQAPFLTPGAASEALLISVEAGPAHVRSC